MKKLFSLIVLSTLAITSADAAWGGSRSNSSNQAQQMQQSNTAGAQNVLFIQTAREAVVERDLGESKGVYTLTLKGVEPNLAFFGDNPQRLAGKVSVSQFINDWIQGTGAMDGGSNANGLNGALVTTSTTPSNVEDLSQSVLILSEPIYDAKTQELKFKIRNITGEKIQSGRHANPILFIDNH